MKVFHAARQDIEIFVLRFGDVPRPLFDTQVAAMVAGFGEQVGYDALVAPGRRLDRQGAPVQRWRRAPCRPSQIAYAAADVTYLRTVYTELRARLAQDGRLDWVAEEMAELADPARTAPTPRRCGNGCARAATTGASSGWCGRWRPGGNARRSG